MERIRKIDGNEYCLLPQYKDGENLEWLGTKGYFYWGENSISPIHQFLWKGNKK